MRQETTDLLPQPRYLNSRDALESNAAGAAFIAALAGLGLIGQWSRTWFASPATLTT